MSLRYLEGVVTLSLDPTRCHGCGRCLEVCPHDVFARDESLPRNAPVLVLDRDACMECGACQRNCPTEAITVRAGVGCAHAVIRSGIRKQPTCCGNQSTCDCG